MIPGPGEVIGPSVGLETATDADATSMRRWRRDVYSARLRAPGPEMVRIRGVRALPATRTEISGDAEENGHCGGERTEPPSNPPVPLRN